MEGVERKEGGREGGKMRVLSVSLFFSFLLFLFLISLAEVETLNVHVQGSGR